jgi:hypothetical protein
MMPDWLSSLVSLVVTFLFRDLVEKALHELMDAS